MKSYSVHLVKDYYNNDRVSSALAISDKCVYLTSNKEKAIDNFEKCKEIIISQKEKMEKDEFRQYLYIIENDSEKTYPYTILKWGYVKDDK